MQWRERATDYIQSLKPAALHDDIVQRIASLVDLTSLNTTDTEADIACAV